MSRLFIISLSLVMAVLVYVCTQSSLTAAQSSSTPVGVSAPQPAPAPSPIPVAPIPSTVPMPSAPTDNSQIRVQLKAKQSTLLASNMDGRIDKLSVHDGDRFSQGQLLVHMACSGPESQLAKARATLEKRRKTLEVNQSLHAMRSLSNLELDLSRAEAREAEAEVHVMSALVQRCTVNAPFAGRVANLQVRAHQAVREGQPIMEIIDDRELEIELIVPSRWLAWLKPGTGFTVDVDETGKSYPAEVTQLSGAVDPVSQSIKVYARIQGKAADLLPGMSGQARFQSPK